MTTVTGSATVGGVTFTATAEIAAPAPVLKLTGGLVVVDGTKLGAVSGQGVNHIVAKVPWSSVEPSQGTYNWSVIDNILSSYPAANITLRIQAGQWAPAWLMTATGRISVTNNARNTTVDCPHWWEPIAMNSWQNMITAAGIRYDGNPRVVMVSADLAMVVYSEPYILGSHQPSGAALFLAGCNQTTQVACIKRSVADTIVAFPTTHVELALHSDMQIPVSGGMIFSWPIGRQLAYDLAVLYGKHIVFSDYGLGTVDTAAANVPTGSITTENKLYAWMKLRSSGGAAAWAGPVTFQLTVGKEPQTQATYTQAAQNAIDLGGSQCETAGWGLLGSNAAGLDAALKANAVSGI